MARPASIALGGYFATPLSQLKLIAHHLRVIGIPDQPIRGFSTPKNRFIMVDPCAADGAAILGLYKLWMGEKLFPLQDYVGAGIYVCEMEQERFKQLEDNIVAHGLRQSGRGENILHADAFNIVYSKSNSYNSYLGAHLLFLNPPYENGKLEARFLERYTPILAPDGTLIYIIPYYALAQSAEILARNYKEINVYKLEPTEFETFKQVVLYANKRADSISHAVPLAELDAYTMLMRYASDADAIPVLSFANAPRNMLMLNTDNGLASWTKETLDVIGLQRSAMPWMNGVKKITPMSDVGVDRSLQSIIGQPMPVAEPMRPAHIASALAVGMFNGHVLTPDDPASGLPRILAKGIFQKDAKKTDVKTDKDGKVTAEVYVQQPKLMVTILDLSTGKYYDLLSGTIPSAAPQIESMTIADLVTYYKVALLALVETQCPPMHDHRKFEQRLSLADLDRPLFTSQHRMVNVLLKQLARKAPAMALGEVGVGKSSMTMAVARNLMPEVFDSMIAQLKAQGFDQAGNNLRPVENVLILCPPHLLENWQDELIEILPGASVRIVDSISDLHNPMPRGYGVGAGLNVYILSRETAKLGHGVDGVTTPACPKCGGKITHTPAQLGAKRVICEHYMRRPANGSAHRALELATMLHKGGFRNSLIRGRFAQQYRVQNDSAWIDANMPHETPYGDTVSGAFARSGFVEYMLKNANSHGADNVADNFISYMLDVDHPDRDQWIADMMIEVLTALKASPHGQYGYATGMAHSLRSILYLIEDSELFESTRVACKALYSVDYYGSTNGWDSLSIEYTKLQVAKANGDTWQSGNWAYSCDPDHGWRLVYKNCDAGSLRATGRVLEVLNAAAAWHVEPCGERLYQAIAKPRRYPLATYISRYCKHMFDMLIVDEGHEYNNDGTAQERAKHRLTKVIPLVIDATGTVMNGYAKSMFRSTWERSPAFRQEFKRDDMMDFVNRYGYRKLLLEKEGQDTVVKSRGIVTDRVDTNMNMLMRAIGEAPGVLPLFVIKYLLPYAAVMLKSDLDEELPTYEEIPMPVAGIGSIGKSLLTEYSNLKNAIGRQIMQDRMNPGLAGKLWGALGRAPSYLDRCHVDTGNAGVKGKRVYEVRYPVIEGDEHGSEKLIHVAKTFSSDAITPKEQAILDLIATELDEDRNILLFCVHTGGSDGVDHRYEKLIKARFGNIVTVMKSNAVKTGIRKQWITEQVVDKKKRVLIVNPVTVQTGLNNLVYFSTVMWAENPECNATTYRQANGRVHRPKQKKPVRVYFPVYEQTSQELALNLLIRKVVIAQRTDGADLISALEDVGAGDGNLDELDLGRAIYDLL